MMTLDALKQNDGLRRLDTVLAQEHWNGIIYIKKSKKCAESVSMIIL